MPDGFKDRPLERYVSVLETLARFPDGLSSTEIEAILKLPKTTVNRLLNILQDSGLAQLTNGRGRKFVLGRRLLRILHLAPDTGWVEAATRRHLRELAETTGETCFVAKLSGRQIKSVISEAPDTPVGTYVVPGSIMPPNVTASAKAILAWQLDDVVSDVLSDPLERFTPNSIVDVDELRADLKRIRKRGYATDLAEHVEGIATIACPVITPSIGCIFSVGITGPYERIAGRGIARLLPPLRTTAEKIAMLVAPHGIGA
jgi:DNA-binding IclR family transcriptional regulator